MKSLLERLDALQKRGGQSFVMALAGLGALTLLLLLGAVIGAFAVGDDGPGGDDTLATGGAGSVAEDGTTDITDGSTAEGGTTDTLPDGSIAPGGPVTGPAGTSGTAKPGASTPGGTTGAAAQAPTAPGADRTGVTATEVKWGLHAPETFDGAPLNLAEDPLEGAREVYLPQINNSGGVNGRKIALVFADDRYTVEGGKAAADRLINDAKVFFATGTLGIDQVAQVATEAKKRNTPYMAGGGPETTMKNLDMFQLLASYDTALESLANYLGSEIKRTGGYYFGLKKIGVTSLDTPYILGSVEGTFKTALEKNGMEMVKVVKVKKPTEQTSYGIQIQQLKDAGAQIVVPAQDPITTSRYVQECAGTCNWKWTIANFAHESDVALSLMAGTWTGVRVLASGCYYTKADIAGPPVTPQCGAVNNARKIWQDVKGADDYLKDGQGGIAGYQFTHFWLKALKDAGADLTRERFRGALLTYDNFNDLITSPITFKGVPNIAHGFDQWLIYEGTTTPAPRQAGYPTSWRQINDGFATF